MEREDLIFNHCRERQVVEDLGEELPDGLSAIFLDTLVIKAICSIDFLAFVVAAEKGDAVSVLDFEDEEVQEGLDAVEASVHIVAHEKKVCFLNDGRSTGSFPQISKISIRS